MGISMLYFPLKLSLYREGNKLWYMSEIANILKVHRKMHEIFLAENLIELSRQKGLFYCNGGIKSKGTAWGYINNAVSLGIVRSEGTWKGTVRARVLTLTCLGEALGLVEVVNGKRLDFPKLNMFEKILLLKRSLELDDLWDGTWIFCIISCIPENEYRYEKKIIEDVSVMIPQLKNLKPRTKEHRIFPKLQWLVDLELVAIREKSDKRCYKLSQSGCIFKKIKNQQHLLGRHYAIIAEIYNLKREAHVDIEKSVTEIFNRLTLSRNQSNNYLMPIPLLRYVTCATLLSKGIVLEEKNFDHVILDLVRKKYFQLHQCPYKTLEPEIFMDGKRYYYISKC
jgi:hypothetical protein